MIVVATLASSRIVMLNRSETSQRGGDDARRVRDEMLLFGPQDIGWCGIQL
jgi:hypothetical protein